MATYFFFGIVVPERADLTIQNAKRALMDVSGKQVGDIQIDIEHSQVLIVLNTELQRDFVTLKNLAYEQARVFVNSASLFLGGGYDLDITKGVDVSSGKVETFAPRATPIVNFISSRQKLKINEVVKATYQTRGRHIECAIEDFSDGLRTQGRNAMFFFYRVFDSLRAFIGDLYSITDDAYQWEKLRDITQISRHDIDFIKGFSDRVRHGGSIEYEIPDIEKAEQLAWSAIHEVIIHYRDRGYK